MMFKLILLLLIVSQINCDEDKQTFSDDEIDINANGTKVVQDKVLNKQKPDFSSDEKDILKRRVEEEIPKNGKNEDKIGSEVDFGKDEKKAEEQPGNEKNHHKKVIGHNNNSDQDKDLNKDENEKKVISGSEEELGDNNNQKKLNKGEVSNGNEIMETLLNFMKRDYRKDFDKISVSNYGPVKYGRWGTVLLHSGVVSGLANVHRHGDILIKISEQNKKLIIGDIVVNDVEADFKVDAKIFNRISVKDRILKLWMKKALLNVVLEVDLSDKKLVVSQINVKSIEGFGARSRRIFWPFNRLADSIIKSQQDIIKAVIKTEISKYMGKVVHDIKFEEVFAKIF